MITYFPWSKQVLDECLAEHDKGGIPTLDFEFTAQCTLISCIYCDSRPKVGIKNPYQLSWNETKKMLLRARELGLKWVYACGLGEPSEDERFEKSIEMISSFGASISLFTNGIRINDVKAKWLLEHNVHIILKLDTFVESTFDHILGKPGASQQIYSALKSLIKAGYGKGLNNGYTNIALSIVPTRFSVNQIADVVQFAKDNNIFPSLGELEQAGRTSPKDVFNSMALSQHDLDVLKSEASTWLWGNYTRPICPTIITGLHIDDIGNCVVDEKTGLNCKWFMLDEPSLKIIGNVQQSDLSDLLDKVKEYRKYCFEHNTEIINRCATTHFPFGGCGGSPDEIIRITKEHI